AAWNNSYGYMIIVDHGGGIATLYAHNSKLLVANGDIVTRGQVIAKAGSTGMSTGPHLHFEVRVNGEYKNPMSYLR
ncbi:MAG: peptidase M23, partial [Firmicutes bacterium HGW-Firmicutes-11]